MTTQHTLTEPTERARFLLRVEEYPLENARGEVEHSLLLVDTATQEGVVLPDVIAKPLLRFIDDPSSEWWDDYPEPVSDVAR